MRRRSDVRIPTDARPKYTPLLMPPRWAGALSLSVLPRESKGISVLSRLLCGIVLSHTSVNSLNIILHTVVPTLKQRRQHGFRRIVRHHILQSCMNSSIRLFLFCLTWGTGYHHIGGCCPGARPRLIVLNTQPTTRVHVAPNRRITRRLRRQSSGRQSPRCNRASTEATRRRNRSRPGPVI